MPKKSARIEWISIIYLIFFVLAVLSPSIHQRGLFGLTETQLEELTIFIFGIAGIITFAAYERLMERREREKQVAESDYQRAKQELIESYAYIGTVNRKIELLKKIANDTSTRMAENSAAPRELFQALAQNAHASVGAKAALLRFVEVSRLRTDSEFSHAPEGQPAVRVANKDLKTLHDEARSHAFIRSEDGDDILVIPSDQKRDLKAFMMLRLDQSQIHELDISLLKVFVNQAEMLYRGFMSQDVVERSELAAPRDA